MSAMTVQVPYPVFYDRTGEPLENGYVWIGESNQMPQTNPINVYFDKDLTQLAAQPLRTIDGYISNAGTPAQIYVNAVNFSILVQEKDGTMVYNFPDGTGLSPNASGVQFTGFRGQNGNVADLGDADGADWIGFTPAGTNAVPLSVQQKLRQSVSVKDFGAVGDGVADDTNAIQAALDSGASNITLGQGTFLITNTLLCPRDVSIYFDTGTLRYNGARNQPALQIATITSTSAGRFALYGVRIVSAVNDWSNMNYVGLRIFASRRNYIQIDLIQGFTIGLECYSSSSGYAYNYHQILDLLDNKYALMLTCDGSYPGSFTNENIFMGGRYGTSSAANALGSAYGVYLRSINNGYKNHNMNRWFSPCFELNDGVLGDERIPFIFDNCGQKNTCYNARWESGRGSFARLDGTVYASVQENNFEVGALGGSFLTIGIDQLGGANNNFYWPVQKQNITQRQSISYDVVSAVKSYNATNASISGGLCFGINSSGNVLLNTTNVISRQNSVELFNRSIGFFVEVDGEDQFTLTSTTDPNGTVGRVGVSAFDENFVQLTNTSPTFPDVVGNPYTSAYGGIFWAGTDRNSITFRLSSQVRYIRVFAASGTNRCWLKSLTLTRTNGTNKPLRCFNNLGVSDFALFSEANPNSGIHGIYGRGDILQNGAAASGQPSYWQCITAGRLAPAWLPSTAYVVGAIVLNDTDKIYACITAGTSAGSGGPTGTGSSIGDDSVTWSYISPAARFLAGANLP